MPTKRNISSTKDVIDLLLTGNNLVKTLGFLSSIVVFSFGIGFYFGNQSEQYKYSVELNNLNFQHIKALNDAIDKEREYQDKINQQRIDELVKIVNDLQSKNNGKPK